MADRKRPPPQRTTIQLRRYARWSESWDHDHCAACWAKFAEFEGLDIQHAGYATCDDYPKGACYEWVCQACFEDLKNDMQWAAISEWPAAHAPQAAIAAIICEGAGASTTTAGFPSRIGMLTPRAWRCSGGEPALRPVP